MIERDVRVAELWRYPVKSMRGEPLAAAELTERGLPGDRAYALLDRETGALASAKHPRRWGALLACAARYVAPPLPGAPPPPVAITLPDGTLVRSDAPDCDALLSRALGRAVNLVTTVEGAPTREADRTPLDAAPGEPLIRREPLALGAPPGTFFDYGPLHLLSTATLAYLQELHPGGRLAASRFRPNLVLAAGGAAPLELAWLGATVGVGGALLRLIDPCPRCVVPTLPQGDLPHDPGILRALAAHTSAASVTLAPGVVFTAVAGVYAAALRAGAVRVGDPVTLAEQ